MTMWRHNSPIRRLAALLLALLTPLAALAEDDPPGRVGRLSDIQGSVSYYDAEQGQWSPASRNRPLTGGDRISTDGDARAELRIGSSTLRLGEGTELELVRVDDDRVIVQLHSGTLALRVRDREVAAETEIVTREARLRPLRSGHFRVDRIDDTTYAASWRGELRVDDGGDAFTVDSGRRAELWREGGGNRLRHAWDSMPDDGFARWVASDDRRDERSASNRYVSPEMTGAEDLDRYGRWDQHPEYGAIWVPLTVQTGWAPYRYGHWAWIRPWGWTWVDDAPWGFAPFHYGRWVNWGGRWAWTPGTYVRRPVFAPALVAWVGGPHIGVSISIGGPSVGWVPLAPREVFVPWYRYSPAYGERVNHRPPGGGWRIPVPTGPIMYGNQGVPNAVTVVPRDVLSRREPVARAVIDLRNNGNNAGQPPQRTPSVPMTAPAGPGGAQPAPGRTVTSDEGRPAPPRRVALPVAPVPQRQVRESPRDNPREGARDNQRDNPRDSARDNPRENPRDIVRDNPRDSGREGQPVRPVNPPAVVEPRQPLAPQQPQPQQPPPQRERPAVQPPQAAPAPAPAPTPAPAPVVRPRPPERVDAPAREREREPVRESPRETPRENPRERADRPDRSERGDRGNPREREQLR